MIMGQLRQPISRPGCAESGLIGGNYILSPSQDEYYARTEITDQIDDWMPARDVGWDWMNLLFFFTNELFMWKSSLNCYTFIFQKFFSLFMIHNVPGDLLFVVFF